MPSVILIFLRRGHPQQRVLCRRRMARHEPAFNRGKNSMTTSQSTNPTTLVKRKIAPLEGEFAAVLITGDSTSTLKQFMAPGPLTDPSIHLLINNHLISSFTAHNARASRGNTHWDRVHLQPTKKSEGESAGDLQCCSSTYDVMRIASGWKRPKAESPAGPQAGATLEGTASKAERW